MLGHLRLNLARQTDQQEAGKKVAMCCPRGPGKKTRRQSEGNPADTWRQKKEEIDSWHRKNTRKQGNTRKTGQKHKKNRAIQGQKDIDSWHGWYWWLGLFSTVSSNVLPERTGQEKEGNPANTRSGKSKKRLTRMVIGSKNCCKYVTSVQTILLEGKHFFELLWLLAASPLFSSLHF